jgi:DNA-binding SARP family transcriptional activator/tetratricopeptide (TPR) repeat protein
VRVCLLGPVDVLADDGTPQPVRGLRRKAVLAALALRAGQVVSTERLAHVVWGDGAPATAANALQSHVSYLRGRLGSKDAIVTRPPGYLLALGDDATDVQVAERMLRESADAADPAGGVVMLRAALALWRGRPLADLAGVTWLEEESGRLDLLRAHVKRALAEAMLAAGQHVQLVPELAVLAAEDPLDERVCAQLMLALYRSGRQADALAAYHRLRHTLSEELGIDPGQPLRALETAILRQDPALDTPAAAASPAALAARLILAVPAQLPPAVPGFAGRGLELASLDALLPESAQHGQGQHGQRQHGQGQASSTAQGQAVVISAVSGTAGVGKTALALYWAHRVAGWFPDGQLYVNLRGFDPGGAALEPTEAVRGFLEALGVPAARIPADLPARTGLYRSLLAGKRMLVLLDNAREAEQVRPLLPGTLGCLAIVTSRNQLAGLVAADGAHPLRLDLLPAVDARDLLARRLGPHRVAAEPDAVDDIISRCARLPLALTVAAARAAANPSFPLAAIAAELRQATSAFDPLDGGDIGSDVRAVFSWSYQALTPEAARLFRLLGLHPGPDVTLPAAASLAAIPLDQARLRLAELTRAHLLAEHSPGRHAFHDLLRAYAAERARANDSERARAAAVSRVIDHCLNTAYASVMLTDASPEPITVAEPRPGVIVVPPATADDALDWFAAEHAVLLAAARLAADTGQEAAAWQLAWTLNAFLLRRGLWQDHEAAQYAGLAAARRAGDTEGEAYSLYCLASGYARSGRFGDADPLYREALELLEKTGSHFNTRAAIHNGLIWVAHGLDRPGDLLGHSMQALEMYRAAGNQSHQLMALNDIGYTHAMLGDYQQALGYCERALAASQELGERHWEFAIWHSLGYIHHQLGSHQRAISCYQQSLDLCRQDADRYGEADALAGLGDVQHSAGDAEAARWAWAHALRIFDEIGHPDSDGVRAKLHARTAAQAVSSAMVDLAGDIDRVADCGRAARIAGRSGGGTGWLTRLAGAIGAAT